MKDLEFGEKGWVDPMSSTYRILIVEDMEPFANFVQSRLESLGYTILGTADSGETAIRMADMMAPDLIIMDITLSTSMTGIEAAQRILRSRNIPIIFLTGSDDKEVLRSGREISNREVFLKPFSEEELHSAIQQAVISNVISQEID